MIVEGREWIILNYTLPKEPSRIRVSIWRRLKKQGTISIGQSMWILPYEEEHVNFFMELSKEIDQNQGVSFLIRSSFLNEKQSDGIIEEFNLARDNEYTEVLEKCADFFREIEKEIKRENFTFAEIEENEYEYNKLIDWYRNIKRRDFFGASLRSRAEQELDRCGLDLEEFSRKIYEINHEVN